MLKALVLGSVANGVAAIAGTVTAVQVLRGKSPTTAAAVTLGGVGVSIAASAVATIQARRMAKAVVDEALAGMSEATQ